MTTLQALVLGLVQGITEFLPVSSSGHLIIFPYFFNWESNINFDILVHLASAIALLIIFRSIWVEIMISIYKDISQKKNISQYSDNTYLAIKIILANIPAAIIGLLFKDFFEGIRSPYIVSIQLVVISIVMMVAENSLSKRSDIKDKINFIDAIIIGVSQVLAFIPGTSRSGVTISTGIFRGITREESARFTFLLVTPLVVMIALYDLLSLQASQILTIENAIGFVTSLIFSIISIKFLLSFVKNNTLKIFIIYRILLAIIILLVVMLNR